MARYLLDNKPGGQSYTTTVPGKPNLSHSFVSAGNASPRLQLTVLDKHLYLLIRATSSRRLWGKPGPLKCPQSVTHLCVDTIRDEATREGKKRGCSKPSILGDLMSVH